MIDIIKFKLKWLNNNKIKKVDKLIRKYIKILLMFILYFIFLNKVINKLTVEINDVIIIIGL